MTVLRNPAVAGSFYPAEPDALRRQLAGFLSETDNAPPAGDIVPKAIIGPHAGYIFSGPVAARAYARLAPARGVIDRVVLVGPSHHVAFRGLAVDTADAWAMPFGPVMLDKDAIARLRRLPGVGELDAAYQREHALEVHVPFLQHVLGQFRLVPMVAGDVPPEAMATALDTVWGGRETLIVISTDLSHYLDYLSCQRKDALTAAAIERLDGAEIGPQEACGVVPTRGLLLTAKRRGLSIERLDLRNSGDTAGSRDRVVGYGAWALREPEVAARPADDMEAAIQRLGPALIDIVRDAIQCGLDTGQPPQPALRPDLPSLLSAHGAAFITLRRNGVLRGCIGSALASRPLVIDVAQHAFNAAFRDWRFPKLAFDELADLDLSVSVLTAPVAMQFASEADLLEQLQPGVDGLIIQDSGHAALFLPSVWAELPDRRHFLLALKQKAGLPPSHFSSGFAARRFRSIEVKGRMVRPLTDAASMGRDVIAWSVIPVEKRSLR